MPLIKSKSKKMSEMQDRPKPGLAIALSVQRKPKKKMAEGGEAKTLGETIGYPGAPKPKPKPMAKGGDVSAVNEPRPSTQETNADAHEQGRQHRYDRKPPTWTEGNRPPESAVITISSGSPVDEDFSGESQASASSASDPTEMGMKGSSTDPEGIDQDHEEDIAPARLAKGGDVTISFQDESEAHADESATSEEMAMEKESSSDPMSINSDHDEDIAPARLSRGGSVAAEIMKRRSKKSSDDGEADLSSNADEDPNMEDDLSADALKKENYSESEGLDELDSPKDSNEDGDEIESDKRDHIGKMRSKMKSKGRI